MEKSLLDELRCPICLGLFCQNKIDKIECTDCKTIFDIEDGIINFHLNTLPRFGKEEHLPEDITILFKNIKKLGWKTGLNNFLYELSAEKFESFHQLVRERQTAWRFLFDFTNCDRVLSIDSGLGTISVFLRKVYNNLYILDFNKERLKCIKRRIIEECKIDKVFYIFSRGVPFLPFPSKFFDAIVTNNIETIFPLLAHLNPKFFFKKFIEESYRILKDTGFIFLTAENKYGYNYLLKSLINFKRHNKNFSLLCINKTFQKVGFRETNFYGLIGGINSISEIKMNHDSKKLVTYKTSIKEIIKDLIYNSKYLFPAFGVIGTKNDLFSPFIVKIYRDIQNKLQGYSVNTFMIKRYLVRHYNAVILIAGSKDQNKDVIIRLPLDSYMESRFRRNSKILRELKNNSNLLPVMSPTHLLEGIYQKQPYFIESVIDGFTLDSVNLPNNLREKIFIDAAQVLIEFHKNSSIECQIDDVLFSELFLKPLFQLKLFVGNKELEWIEEIKKYLNKIVLGEKLNLVWMHGDFNIENVVIDFKTLKINGIIDWDLSQKRGLPLIDMFQLFIYNYVLFRQEKYSRIFIERIIPQNFSEDEKYLFKRYTEALSVPTEMILPLSIMNWIHHIVYRCAPEIKLNKMWFEENVINVMKIFKTLL